MAVKFPDHIHGHFNQFLMFAIFSIEVYNILTCTVV